MEEEKGKPADPCVMVIFGAAGDLTKRLLLPSLSHIGSLGLLSETFDVVGISHGVHNTETYRKFFQEDVDRYVVDKKAAEYGRQLASKVHYVTGEFDDQNTYVKLKELLDKMKKDGSSDNYLFYLATPPRFFSIIIRQLGECGLVQQEEDIWRRVIIEKPFGHDLESAVALNHDIKQVLRESQIFRIDHYLGKETVQNIMAFRFANGIFEPIWNRRYIDHIQITVAETLGMGLRGAYYEQAGALRDMVPNHMFQLLSLIAMEPPISFSAHAVRDEKSKVLRAVQQMTPEDVLACVVRGQYGAGTVDGQSVAGYRSESRVANESSTETFVALKLMVENWRWAGVPFYLRTGKRLAKRVTEIVIQFKTAPTIMFQSAQIKKLSANQLVIHIQPEEGISLRFGAKLPGPVVRIGDVNMTFNYKDYFGHRPPQTGYETLLYDAMMGDGTLFQRDDMIECGWRVVEPLIDVWNAMAPRNFPNYQAGSFGPKEADDLLQRDGRQWRDTGANRG